jgi:hypothetical protein
MIHTVQQTRKIGCTFNMGGTGHSCALCKTQVWNIATLVCSLWTALAKFVSSTGHLCILHWPSFASSNRREAFARPFRFCTLARLHPQNLETQFTNKGYLYEQYDDTNGRGSGSHPFNGWTALAALIAVEHWLLYRPNIWFWLSL